MWFVLGLLFWTTLTVSIVTVSHVALSAASYLCRRWPSVMLTRTGHARTRTLIWLTKNKDRDLNLVLKDKDIAYSYLLQVGSCS